jgi:hypothetical protein
MRGKRFETAAVVLGMHRSGTSAIAGVLALAGFSAPKTLLPTSAANERGFWESEPVKALDDQLFSELGTSWHALEAISFESLQKQRLRSAQSRAKATLEEEFELGSRPLIKDPRLCRLLPLWKPALADLAARTVYAITVRSPLEVARSLTQRNDFDVDLSCLLWARHYLDAEYHTRGLPRVWITYEALIADWRRSLHVFERQFGEFQLDSIAEDNIDQFISAQLRHHRTADEQAFIELERLPIVQQTYRILLDATRMGDVGDADLRNLDTLRGRFDDLSNTLSRVFENARLDRKRLANARAQGEAASAELAQARRAVADLDAVRSALETQSAAQQSLEARINSAVESLAEAIQQRSVLEQKLSDAVSSAAQERTDLQQMLADAKSEAREERESFEKKLTATASERDALGIEIDRLRADAERTAAELQGALRELTATASERDALSVKRADAERTAAELQGALGELRADHEFVQTELKDVKRKYRSTQYQLARDREKLRRTQEQLADVGRELAALRQSRVWRIYTALQESVRRSTGIVHRVIGGKDRKRKVESASLLRKSPLFDPDWYLSRYPDVAAAGIDPVVHYLESGWREGRDPSPRFSTTSYLKANADVAQAALNPLLHYLEFGYSEGRHINELSRPPVPPVPASEQELPPAATCVSFPLAVQLPVRWRRAARLGGPGMDLVMVGGQRVGLAGDADQRLAVEAAFLRLAALSGYSLAPLPAPGHAESVDSAKLLVDIWHVNEGRLRCRWRTEAGAIVIRAYQHDPAREGTLSLVGEGLITSETDFFDVSLANAYFPVLFVICEPNGAIADVNLLAFPSLCRGGLHYPELVALHRDAPYSQNSHLDVIGTAEVLAGHLSRALHEACSSFVGEILIDLAGADGSEPLFQNDTRAWLSKVMRTGVRPLETASSNASEIYLRDAVTVDIAFRKRGRTVTLPADAVPSISLLAMPAGIGKENGGKLALPLIIAGDDPAQPSTLLDLPPTSAQSTIASTNGHPSPWPHICGGETEPAERLQVAAIRHLRRPLPNDSELLLPIAPGALNVRENDRPITWLVFPEDWDEAALRRSLEALALQRSSKPIMLALVGDVQSTIASVANEIFGSRVTFGPDVTAALDGVKTPLVGYLGAHVVLHDSRTCRILSALLENSTVVSAACVLVATEKHGKGWQISVADPGALAGMNESDGPHPRHCKEAELFWRATYAALRPPRDLWIARSNIARRWLQRAGPMGPNEGFHVCTSLVTASYIAVRSQIPAHLRPPASSELQSLRSAVLVG